jgi:hypothetical protein
MDVIFSWLTNLPNLPRQCFSFWEIRTKAAKSLPALGQKWQKKTPGGAPLLSWKNTLSR